MHGPWNLRLVCGAVLALHILSARSASAVQDPTKENGWSVTRETGTGLRVQTLEMTLHPQPEPRPALQYRLLPDDFDLIEGNAAIYYLKAMGFLEQSPARDRLSEVYREAHRQAQSDDAAIRSQSPHAWQSMTPAELPLPAVKEFLRLTAFQQPFLSEAARRRHMDLDRQIRDQQDPIGYLLPEIQTMRELARMQSLRSKVAIAEGRVADALSIAQQQFAMARHLGEDDFLVSNLVGIAIAGIAWQDMLQLVQRPETPNLYWAMASLPAPMFSMARANGFERQILFEQFKQLREVNEELRPPSYWREFVDRLAEQLGSLAWDLGLPVEHAGDAAAARHHIVGFVALAYPQARRYLIEECGLPPEQVDAYPTAQTVFLAVVRHYRIARDDHFKWDYLPFWQTPLGAQQRGTLAGVGTEPSAVDEGTDPAWYSLPADLLLPMVGATRVASIRSQQMIALLQTVEAIRMYGAMHGRQLPARLDDLPLPAPAEPITGQPLDYRLEGDHAVLSGHPMPGLQYRLVLRFAQGE